MCCHERSMCHGYLSHAFCNIELKKLCGPQIKCLTNSSLQLINLYENGKLKRCSFLTLKVFPKDITICTSLWHEGFQRFITCSLFIRRKKTFFCTDKTLLVCIIYPNTETRSMEQNYQGSNGTGFSPCLARNKFSAKKLTQVADSFALSY